MSVEQARPAFYIQYKTTVQMSFEQPIWTVRPEEGDPGKTVWFYSEASAEMSAESMVIYGPRSTTIYGGHVPWIVEKHDKGVTTQVRRVTMESMYPTKPRY